MAQAEVVGSRSIYGSEMVGAFTRMGWVRRKLRA